MITCIKSYIKRLKTIQILIEKDGQPNNGHIFSWLFKFVSFLTQSLVEGVSEVNKREVRETNKGKFMIHTGSHIVCNSFFQIL